MAPAVHCRGNCADGLYLTSHQCDETKPTCKQCAKSRRQCPGYKDEFDLIFRNETKATERRARKANTKAVAQRLGQRGPDSPTSLKGLLSLPASQGSSGASPGGAIMPPLNMPPEQLASCHFLSNFVLIPRHDTVRGYMDYVIPLLRSESHSSTFAHAFNACAFASLGNRVTSNGVDFGDKALSEYTKALAATHVALKDPELSTADGTLAAVLLLGFFEVCASPRSVWTAPPVG